MDKPLEYMDEGWLDKLDALIGKYEDIIDECTTVEEFKKNLYPMFKELLAEDQDNNTVWKSVDDNNLTNIPPGQYMTTQGCDKFVEDHIEELKNGLLQTGLDANADYIKSMTNLSDIWVQGYFNGFFEAVCICVQDGEQLLEYLWYTLFKTE